MIRLTRIEQGLHACSKAPAAGDNCVAYLKHSSMDLVRGNYSPKQSIHGGFSGILAGAGDGAGVSWGIRSAFMLELREGSYRQPPIVLQVGRLARLQGTRR